MAKTLRVRTRTGWVTKPFDNTATSILTAEEVDDTFLEFEADIDAKQVYDVGDCILVATAVVTTGWVLMDGTTYNDSTYPLLSPLLGGGGGTFTVPSYTDAPAGYEWRIKAE